MAVRPFTVYTTDGAHRARVIGWEGLTTDDTGYPINVTAWGDKSLHGFGDWGGTGNMVIQGSNDPRANPKDPDHSNAKWVTLTDAQGNSISKTADFIEQILENPVWIRPYCTLGTNPDLDAIIAMRGDM
jgi:hypothetical protein